MKNIRFARKMTALLIAMLLMAAVPAFAITDQKGEQDTEPAIIVEVAETPVPAAPDATPNVPVVTSQPFSVVGNAEVLDDIDDGSKEFYTITTANNNTFFIVIDKARTSENVYMLAKVDENDLAEFVEGGMPTAAPTQQPQPTVIIQQPTPAPTPTVIETEPEQEEPEISSYVVIGALALAAVIGLYFFKSSKAKKEAMYDDSEGMEYDDSEDEASEE